METKIFSNLAGVRKRQRLELGLKAAASGLLAGAAFAFSFGLIRVAMAMTLSWLVIVGCLAVGMVIGLAVGLLWKRRWEDAASAVDTHYHLKDRAITALEFAQKEDDSALHHLAVEDAAQHLESVEPQQVVPMRMPKLLPYAVAASIVAFALLAWQPVTQETIAGPVAPIAEILQVAEDIEERLEQMEEVAQEEDDEELKKLAEQLRKDVEEMKEDDVDVREALAKLSEMQAEIAQQQAEYNEPLTTKNLEELGTALQTSAELREAGKDLEEGKFEEAAEKLSELENLDELDRREARATAEKVSEIAKNMKKAGLKELSESAERLSKSLKEGDKEGACKECKGIGEKVDKHAKRNAIARMLKREMDKLNESKSICQSCQKSGDKQCKNCGSKACKGDGECKAKANSLAELNKPKVSNKSTDTWGKGTSGVLNGDKTNLDSKRKIQEVTGQAGDGPSEYEVSKNAEGEATAKRGYRDTYKEYKKQSEAVLESEPIPLGQRQTIRRYFELIRPQDGDTKAAEGE